MSSPQPVPAVPSSLALEVLVDDPEIVAALAALPEGRQRDAFVRSALRIGVLALQQAQGRIDADVVRNEGQRLVDAMASALGEHQRQLGRDVQSTLKEYFDPESGRFNERVKRLVSKDGELEALLRRQVGAADSDLARTLQLHLGADSPLLRMLSPDASKGILASLQTVMKGELDDQRDRILKQFSLDNSDGAMSRFVKQLDERMENVVGEFSLDKKDSALSRLVVQVTVAQEKISSELSLDAEGSGLARMRKELLALIGEQGAASQKFQEEVKVALASMQARKSEAEKSTRHGDTFESSVGSFVAPHVARAGDILEATGQSTGLIRGNKKGDFVLTLGADARAHGARICIEAKQDADYDLKLALAEIDEARKNRGSEVGLFVWSRRSAPAGTSPLARHGQDVVVLWDSEDEATDPFLVAGLSLARALCTRAAHDRERQAADLEAMEKSIRAIEKQAGLLDEIDKSAATIKSGSDTILNRVRIAKADLLTHVRHLDATLDDLKGDVAAS